MKDLRLKLAWVMENVGAVHFGGALAGLAGRPLAGLSTDSRTLKPGEVFVALPGERFDGHDHVSAALARGALAAIVQRPLPGEAGARSIIVPDTLRTLGDLAGCLRRRQNLRVVGLTGSNGKTTTKEMIAAILGRADRRLLATAGNFNNLVGLPLTLFRLGPATRLAVLEMGMNHFGEIARLTEIAGPDVALVTSVGPAHLEFFDSVSQVARAKGELYAGLRADALAVVDDDVPLLRREARRFAGNHLYFGSTPRSEVRLGRVSAGSPAGQTLTFHGPGAARGRRVALRLLGRHNARNALAAAAASLAAGADWDQIKEGLESVRGLPGRLSAGRAGGLWVLDDSYNANPASVAAGLEVLAGLKPRGGRGAILGDMLELGPSGPAWHRRIGRLAARLKFDFLALVGPLSGGTAAAARRAGLPREAVGEFETPEEAAAWVLGRGRRGTAVLVKASRGLRLERAVERLRAGAEIGIRRLEE